jgi:hypothetical protein
MASSLSSSHSICPICRDSLTESQEVQNTHEGEKVTHLFHKSCLDSWFATGQRTCPLCNVIVLDKELMRTQRGRSELLTHALTHHNLREIEMILTAGSVDEAVRFQALQTFIQDDRIALFDQFFDGRSSIDSSHLLMLGSLAASCNRQEILASFLRKSRLNPEERGAVFKQAVERNPISEEILDLLISDGAFDLRTLNSAIGYAVETNRPEFLRRLLPLSDVFFLNKLKSRAKAFRHFEVLKLLEDPRLARSASIESHLINQPEEVCIGLMTGVFGIVLLFCIFNGVYELLNLEVPLD